MFTVQVAGNSTGQSLDNLATFKKKKKRKKKGRRKEEDKMNYIVRKDKRRSLWSWHHTHLSILRVQASTF